MYICTTNQINMSDNQYKPKPNSGTMFKNDKGDNEKRPDYKGTFTAEDGQEYWVSAWVRKSKNGTKYISYLHNLKEQKMTTASSSTPAAAKSPDVDDLPF